MLRNTVTLLSAFLLSACFAGSALAASALDILDRERDRTRAASRSQPKIQISEDRQPSPLDSSLQFTLRSLHLSGNTVFSESELLAAYANLNGSRISFETLNSIAAELTKKYRDAGYLLSRVILPAQEVEQAGADIRLTTIEGFISSIEYTGDERILERFKAYFSPAEKRLLATKPLKHGDFERQMLLLQDLPGIKVNSRFQTGPVSGGSVLILDLQGDLLEGSAGWSNSGTDSAGPGILSLSAGVNTIPFIGSKTTVSYSQADNFQEYSSISVAESYQFWNGLSFRASYAYSQSPQPDTDFARLFDYETMSHTFKLGAAYPLLRGRDLNLSLGMDYEHRNSDAFLLDERFTRDKLRTLSVNANFDFSDALGGVTQLIPTVYRGLDVFEATDKNLESTNTLAPAEFWKLDLYLSRNQQLPYNLSIFTSAEAQFSSDSLSSYNKFSFGGGQFGRGYDPGIIEGDNAFAVNVEPRWTYYVTDKTAVQPFLFIDWGSVWTSKSVDGAPDEQQASSWGGGVRLWGHIGKDELPDFNLSVLMGRPIQRSGSYPDSEMGSRFMFQGTLYF